LGKKKKDSEEIHTGKSTLAADMAMLLNDQEYSDITVDVDGKKIYAHRCILKVRAPVFLASLQTTSGNVWHSAAVNRDETFGYDGYMALLRYIYTGELDLSYYNATLSTVLMNNAARFELFPLALVMSFCYL